MTVEKTDLSKPTGCLESGVTAVMAYSLVLISPKLLSLTISASRNVSFGRYGPVNKKSLSRLGRIRAVQENGAPRRLVDIISVIPELSRNYFRSPARRALFGGISLLGGFYVAQTISLSFGALGVNDVIAAVLCVLLTEYVTKFYYTRPKGTYYDWRWEGMVCTHMFPCFSILTSFYSIIANR
ncbi:hypothetical protein H6P81_012307 [Aristolochia fimbriata]|uniref:Uncharacterized protein n=1 Tax=Aristolochia fimbriata TaxID=158543 RepID=A0AAV7EBU6_ARIFI|nr:hypothetical protein H6P81_012307 [Aristolochia fimbriata]